MKQNSYKELFEYLETNLTLWNTHSISNNRYIAMAWMMKSSKTHIVRWITNCSMDNLVEDGVYDKVHLLFI